MTLTVIALLALFINLDAQRGGRNNLDRPARSGNNLMRMVHRLEIHQKALGITDAQLKEIKGLGETLAEKNVQLENKGNLLELDLGKLMSQDKKDYDKIQGTMNKLAEIRTERRINGLKAHDAVAKILTPEQMEKLRLERRGLKNDRQGRRNDRSPMNGRKSQRGSGYPGMGRN
jgi:Spy/CpxP family protein refolding chaperone